MGSGLAAVSANAVSLESLLLTGNGLRVASATNLMGGGAYFSECAAVSLVDTSFIQNSLTNTGTGSVVGAGHCFLFLALD